MTNLEGDIQKTQIEFDQSTAKIEFYKHKLENEPGSSVWQSKLDEEEVNRIALNEKLKNLKNQRKALDSSGFNTAGNDGVFAKAWGPMIFRVEQIADQTGVIDAATGKEIPDRVPSVRLFALFDQQAFATNSVASAASGGVAFTPKLRDDDPIRLSGARSKTIDFEPPGRSIDSFKLEHAGGEPVSGSPAQLILDQTGRSATLTVNPAVSPGDYDVIFDVTLNDGTSRKDASVRVKIVQ